MERLIIVMILVVMVSALLLVAGMATAQQPGQEPQPTYTPHPFDPRDFVTLYRPYKQYFPVAAGD